MGKGRKLEFYKLFSVVNDCRGSKIDLYWDGKKIYDVSLETGTLFPSLFNLWVKPQRTKRESFFANSEMEKGRKNGSQSNFGKTRAKHILRSTVKDNFRIENSGFGNPNPIRTVTLLVRWPYKNLT